MEVTLTGYANDYVCKGMAGGQVVVSWMTNNSCWLGFVNTHIRLFTTNPNTIVHCFYSNLITISRNLFPFIITALHHNPSPTTPLFLTLCIGDTSQSRRWGLSQGRSRDRCSTAFSCRQYSAVWCHGGHIAGARKGRREVRNRVW